MVDMKYSDVLELDAKFSQTTYLSFIYSTTTRVHHLHVCLCDSQLYVFYYMFDYEVNIHKVQRLYVTILYAYLTYRVFEKYITYYTTRNAHHFYVYLCEYQL